MAYAEGFSKGVMKDKFDSITRGLGKQEERNRKEKQNEDLNPNRNIIDVIGKGVTNFVGKLNEGVTKGIKMAQDGAKKLKK